MSQDVLTCTMDWEKIDSGKKIKRDYKFSNFKAALDFVNKVADLAEEANHHPDIYISYNKVVLELTTHDSNGLTEKDFSLAKKIDTIV